MGLVNTRLVFGRKKIQKKIVEKCKKSTKGMVSKYNQTKYIWRLFSRSIAIRGLFHYFWQLFQTKKQFSLQQKPAY